MTLASSFVGPGNELEEQNAALEADISRLELQNAALKAQNFTLEENYPNRYKQFHERS